MTRRLVLLLALCTGCSRPTPIPSPAGTEWVGREMVVNKQDGGCVAYLTEENLDRDVAVLPPGLRVRTGGPPDADDHLPIVILEGPHQGRPAEIRSEYLSPMPPRS